MNKSIKNGYAEIEYRQLKSFAAEVRVDIYWSRAVLLAVFIRHTTDSLLSNIESFPDIPLQN